MRLNFVSIKLSKVLILLLPLAVLSLVAFSCVAPASGGGCAGPAAQGWSGFAGYNGMLYFGSMDGGVVALSLSARSQEKAFPSESDGEWELRVKAPAAAAPMCGPLGCAPAPRVAIYGTPVVAGDLVYIGTYNGKVMAINRLDPGYDEEGNPSWKKQGEWVYPRGQTSYIGAIVGSLVCVEDTLYVGSSDGKVYALDAVYGEKRWEFDTGDKIWKSPAVKDGVVYVGNYGGKLYALSSQDGNLLGEMELPASPASSPVVSGGSVFIGTFDRHLYAVGIPAGTQEWDFERAKKREFKGDKWFWADPVVQESVVYAGCLDHKIYAFDIGSGRELWQFPADGPIVSTPVLVNDLLVAVSELGTMYVLKADSGVLQRTVSIGYSVMAPLYAEENMVYVHARDRCIYSVDVQSGGIAWKFSSDIE